MAALPLKLVLDTNTVLRGLAGRESASGHILRACGDRRMLALLSRDVLSEYRRILNAPEILERHPEITPKAIELVLRRLRYFGEYFPSVNVRFRFSRDPDDAKLIELAIAGGANFIVTYDRDLLSLPSAHSDDAKRFRQRLPHVGVVTAAELVEQLPDTFGAHE